MARICTRSGYAAFVSTLRPFTRAHGSWLVVWCTWLGCLVHVKLGKPCGVGCVVRWGDAHLKQDDSVPELIIIFRGFKMHAVEPDKLMRVIQQRVIQWHLDKVHKERPT